MIRAILLPGTGGVVMTTAISGTYNHADLAAAKASVQSTIAANKQGYANGYDAFVVDTDKQTLLAWATVPQPTLDWKDTPQR